MLSTPINISEKVEGNFDGSWIYIYIYRMQMLQSSTPWFCICHSAFAPSLISFAAKQQTHKYMHTWKKKMKATYLHKMYLHVGGYICMTKTKWKTFEFLGWKTLWIYESRTLAVICTYTIVSSYTYGNNNYFCFLFIKSVKHRGFAELVMPMDQWYSLF